MAKLQPNALEQIPPHSRFPAVGTARKLFSIALVVTIASALPWGILFGVNIAMGEAPLGQNRRKCTRYCHDHGCRHIPVLPASLTSSSGLFGDTVRGLHWLGSLTGLGPGRGYGVANLAIFCALWPGLMLALVGYATAQGAEIRVLRRELDG